MSKRTQLNLQVPAELLAELDAMRLGSEFKATKSEFVRTILQRAVDQWKRSEAARRKPRAK
jgi:metal-responsive CopG/Arc/MetJ family transcriptional regulator